MPEINIVILEEAAALLRELLDELVFVGGATLGLLITDHGAAPVRATVDVDVIAEITTYMEYFDFSERLRKCGFKEDTSENPLNCRWFHGQLILDVMPANNGILGNVNRWYQDALASAQSITLPSGISIRIISAPYFLGTKFEAFRDRGNRDFLSSRDLEDFIAVIDGRKGIVQELRLAPVDLQRYLAKAVQELLSEQQFLEALPGYLLPDETSQERLRGLQAKLASIVAG